MLVALALPAAAPRLAHADEAWRGDRAREREFSIGVLATRSPVQPYLLVGYELGCHYLRAGDGIPTSAGGGFIYSGPSAGAGLDTRVGRDWWIRLEGRAFALVRGYPDSMLRDAPELAGATRWLTGFSVGAGVVRGFDL